MFPEPLDQMVPMPGVEGFTLNYVAYNQLNFDVMKDMAISDEQHYIKMLRHLKF